MATVDRIEDVVDDERVGRRRAIAPRPWPATRAEHDEPGCHGAQILSSRSATGFPGRFRALGGLEERPGFAGALRTSGGLEERPGFAGALRTSGGLEERPGFAGALRTSAGFGGPCRGPPCIPSPISTAPGPRPPAGRRAPGM